MRLEEPALGGSGLWSCAGLRGPGGPPASLLDPIATGAEAELQCASQCCNSGSNNRSGGREPPPLAAPRPSTLTLRPCPHTIHRRELVLHSVNVAVLGAMFNWGATPRPSNIGVQDYGGGLKTLGLCPPSPHCISTAEEANAPEHYVPQW